MLIRRLTHRKRTLGDATTLTTAWGTTVQAPSIFDPAVIAAQQDAVLAQQLADRQAFQNQMKAEYTSQALAQGYSAAQAQARADAVYNAATLMNPATVAYSQPQPNYGTGAYLSTMTPAQVAVFQQPPAAAATGSAPPPLNTSLNQNSALKKEKVVYNPVVTDPAKTTNTQTPSNQTVSFKVNSTGGSTTTQTTKQTSSSGRQVVSTPISQATAQQTVDKLVEQAKQLPSWFWFAAAAAAGVYLSHAKENTMNELLKIAMLGIGGYFALQYFTKKTEPEAAKEPAAKPPSTSDVLAQAKAPAQGGPNPLQAAIDPTYAATIGNLLLYTPDEWNFFRSQVTSVPTTTDLVDDANRSTKVTASQYHKLRAAKGLSGIARRSWGVA